MKGGTTMLYHFITLHPDIEKAKAKEIHYFTLNYDKGDEWYYDHFSSHPNRLTGEASPTYFDCAETSTIPAMIKRMNNEMKIILVVRDPVERAVSHYNHFCKINKFPEVLALDVNEFFNIPFREVVTRSTTLGFRAEQAISFSLYYRKYLSYESIFKKEDMLVISNRSLRDAPFDTMKDVYKLLGVQYVQNNRFKDIGYSHGTDLTRLSMSTFTRLAELLYPDYKKFCDKTGIPYTELDPAAVLAPTVDNRVKLGSEETQEQA
jgi:hypothetical protein